MSREDEHRPQPPVSNFGKAKLTRREILKSSLTAGGALLVGIQDLQIPSYCQAVHKPAFVGGKYLGLVEFAAERGYGDSHRGQIDWVF